MKANSQQVNLYQSAFRKPRVPLSAKHAIRLSVILVASLVVVSVFTHYETQKLQRIVETAAEQSKALTHQSDKYNQLAKQAGGENVDELIATLKIMRAQREQVLSNMSTQSEHNNRLFSSYFEGLARRTLDGLWLDNVRISDGGETISLTGNTYRAELIPELISLLKHEPAFRGVTFSHAEVAPDPDTEHDDLLTFSLVTRIDSKQEGNQ